MRPGLVIKIKNELPSFPSDNFKFIILLKKVKRLEIFHALSIVLILTVLLVKLKLLLVDSYSMLLESQMKPSNK